MKKLLVADFIEGLDDLQEDISSGLFRIVCVGELGDVSLGIVSIGIYS